MSWRMPHEGAPHTRTWLAWPTTGYTLGDTPAEAEAARHTWAAVANAIVDHEPVTMVVDPRDRDVAPRYLDGRIERMQAPLDDAWMRDIGPTFVIDDETGRLGAVDWVFNGWGGQEWASWGLDARIGEAVAAAAGAERIPSRLTNEGGGIHVDGEGTVLLTRTVQLDPGRNPGWTEADVEAELAATIGATHAIWFDRGLWRDSQRFGTRGHVDILATFARPGLVLLHDQRDAAHPDHAVTAEARAALATATDAAGRAIEVVGLPAPVTLRDHDGWVDFSYVNHLLVGTGAGAVIACVFDDPADDEALEVLASAYPGRAIVPVDARELFARGGGIHCITQHEPHP
jgi:agmatine deiminase